MLKAFRPRTANKVDPGGHPSRPDDRPLGRDPRAPPRAEPPGRVRDCKRRGGRLPGFLPRATKIARPPRDPASRRRGRRAGTFRRRSEPLTRRSSRQEGRDPRTEGTCTSFRRAPPTRRSTSWRKRGSGVLATTGGVCFPMLNEGARGRRLAPRTPTSQLAWLPAPAAGGDRPNVGFPRSSRCSSRNGVTGGLPPSRARVPYEVLIAPSRQRAGGPAKRFFWRLHCACSRRSSAGCTRSAGEPASSRLNALAARRPCHWAPRALFPRTTRAWQGSSSAAGVYIDAVAPEEAAAELRGGLGAYSPDGFRARTVFLVAKSAEPASIAATEVQALVLSPALISITVSTCVHVRRSAAFFFPWSGIWALFVQ